MPLPRKRPFVKRQRRPGEFKGSALECGMTALSRGLRADLMYKIKNNFISPFYCSVKSNKSNSL